MPSFPIDPEIPLRRGALRSIDEAREFAREMAAGHPGAAWQAMLRMLDRVRTEDDALEAAVAIEGLLEDERLLLVSETKVPPAPVRAPVPEPQPVSGSGVSLLYATARAAAADR